MGAQGRFFGRWMLPVYPALCVLAAYAAVAAADALRRAPRGGPRRDHGAAVRAGRAGERARRPRAGPRGHACGGARVDRRARARGRAGWWSSRSCPPRGATRSGGRSSRSSGPSRPTRSGCARAASTATATRATAGSIVGRHQKERGLKAGLTQWRRYYARAGRASEETVTFSPFAEGAEPVRFLLRHSFNYRPRAYERPGPVVEIHRLRDCTPAVG